MIILLEHIISNINTYRMLDNPVLTFRYSYIHKIINITSLAALWGYTIYFFINRSLDLIFIMNSIVITTLCFSLLFMSLIENQITHKGISLTNLGIYLWNDIDRVEFDNKYLIVYYKVKIPITKPINCIKVKLPSEKSEEILNAIESNLNKKIIYTKS
ncbi:hypothetical protein SDC9_64236 [bioreactor metagenome]|uniref:DUF5673 domain-containing protein n=1 Tax=bioreactor metagenome TaxID=1076179 RepID=A0A644XPD5_9ZZZZ